jgi:hypothetical protein
MKVVVLEEIYNFLLDNFFIWIHLVHENKLLNKIQFFWIFQMISHGEKTKPKVVVLEEICNFTTNNFLFEII